MVHITSIPNDMGISAACTEEMATSCSLRNKLLAKFETEQTLISKPMPVG